MTDIGKLHIESRTLKTSGGALRVEIEYPVISGCPHAAELSAYYRRWAEKRRRVCDGLPRHHAERQAALQPGSQTARAGSSFSVMYADAGFLSFFCDSWEELGTAGSFLRREAWTWELASGRALSAAYFFRRASRWSEFAADRIAQQIAAQQAEEEGSFFADAGKNCRTLHGFYLADDGMVFFYPVERLGPRALGIPSFLVKYGDFGDMLRFRL